MKLLIAVDMEGITGVSHSSHVTPDGSPDYGRFRRQMTADVNAAIRGAADAGVDDFIVTDGHWKGLNILIEELDHRARLISGLQGEFKMVEGVQQKVDAAFFIGYHAMVGTQNAVLDHAWTSSRVHRVWLNGQPMGETMLNAALCGHFNVPVIMVSGDQSLAEEVRALLPGVETAVVKTALGRMTADCLPPEESEQLIYNHAYRACQLFHSGEAAKAWLPSAPFEIKVETGNTFHADVASSCPGAERLDGRTLVVRGKDMPEVFKAFGTMVTLMFTA